MDKNRSEYQSEVGILKLLANEARLMMIDRLSKGDCSTQELIQMVGVDQSTVSRHLALLRSSGLIQYRREGSTMFYSLLVPCIRKFLTCITDVACERRVTL